MLRGGRLSKELPFIPGYRLLPGAALSLIHKTRNRHLDNFLFKRLHVNILKSVL